MVRSLNSSQSCTVLPSLPGYRVKNPPQAKIAKSFHVVNGLRTVKGNDGVRELRDGLPHTMKSQMQARSMTRSQSSIIRTDPSRESHYAIQRQSWDRERYDDPLSKESKPLPFTNAKPIRAAFLTNNRVLKFHTFFTEDVSESPDEKYRVRKVDLYFYSEDGTIHLEEPRQENSGIPQGKFLRRQKMFKENGSPYNLEDLRIGNVIKCTGRDFFIADCDAPTKSYLEGLGYPCQPLPYPKGEHDFFMENAEKNRGGDPTHNYGKQLTSMKYFMEAALGQNVKKHGVNEDNRILRFYTVWDDRESLYGTLGKYHLLYYLSDQTVEVVEDKESTAGLDTFPKLLGRNRLPKNHEGEIYNDTDRGVEEPNPPSMYYCDKDLRIGATINVWGRPMLIVDCDRFTRDYFKTKYHMQDTDFTPIDVKGSPRPNYERIPPPHMGFGSDEDSLASWLHLHPKKPPKDLVKLSKYDGKVLQFAVSPLNGPSVRLGRRFSLKYFLADDTMGVYDIPVKNAGVVPGCFLRRAKFKTPDGSRYYTSDDFYVGAEITLASHVFKITYANEFTRNFISGIPEASKDEPPEQITATMKIKLMQKNKSRGFLREAFRLVDEDSDSKMTLDEMKKYLEDSVCRGEKLSPETVLEIYKSLDLNKDNIVDFNEFCAALTIDDGEAVCSSEVKGDVAANQAAPGLRLLAGAMKSDFQKFDKLVRQHISDNTDNITAEFLRNCLVSLRRHFKLSMKNDEIQYLLGYLYPGAARYIARRDLYALLDRIAAKQQ